MVMNGTTGTGVSVALTLVGVGLTRVAGGPDAGWCGAAGGGSWNWQPSFQGEKLVCPDLRSWCFPYVLVPIFVEKPCQSSLTGFGA